MQAKDILKSFLFIVVAIWLQVIFPGVDFFVVGIIVLLQEERFKQLLIFLPIVILIQEGLGTFLFGSSILFYTVVIIFFYVCKWAFRVENFIFIFILSGAVSLAHYYIFLMMANLQEITVDKTVLLDESTMQALLIPFFWLAIKYIKKLKI